MTFSEAIFCNSYDGYGKYFSYFEYGTGGIFGTYNRTMAIMHEFGHSFAYFNMGNKYFSWLYNENYRENWGIWYMNANYNSPYGFLTQNFKGFGWSILFNLGLCP